jgi:hypothetical protein
MVSDDIRAPRPEGPVEPQELEQAAESQAGMAPGVPEEEVEFEELELVDDDSGAAAPEIGLSEAEKRKELDDLLSSGGIKTWTLEDLRRLLEAGRSAIVMENGVYRIKEEIYTSGEKAIEKRRQTSLRALAEEVIGRGSTKEPAPVGALGDEGREEPAFGGIGDLIRDEDTIDLSKIVSRDYEAPVEESLSFEREKNNPVLLKRNGIDYDEFLSSYPRSFTHTTQMKSLVEISRRVSAVSAALLIKKVQGYAPDLTIGLGEITLQSLTFDSADPFHTSLLQLRKAIAIIRNPAEVRFLRARIAAEDLRYVKRVLLLPATFRGQEAYLFLSFAAEVDISIEEVLSKLVVLEK